MVWFFHLFKSFPQLVVIHTVKGFGVVSKAEVDVFLEFSCPGGSEVKASASNMGDLASIPGLGIYPGEGHGNPLKYFCLENPIYGRLHTMGLQRVRQD